MSETLPAIALAAASIGANPVRLWGLTMAERSARIARAAGLEADPAAPASGPLLLAHNG